MGRVAAVGARPVRGTRLGADGASPFHLLRLNPMNFTSGGPYFAYHFVQVLGLL